MANNIDNLLLSQKEIVLRLGDWWADRSTQPDTEMFLKDLLSFVTAMLDNMADHGCVILVKTHLDIESHYLPFLWDVAEWLSDFSKVYAEERLEGELLEAYMLAVKAQLNSGIQAWKAEALRYARRQQKFAALHIPGPEPARRETRAVAGDDAPAERESAAGPAPAAGESDVSLESQKAERKKLRDDYRAECKQAGVRVTDEMIAKAASARWSTRTQVQKWLDCDPDYNGEPDRMIRRVFEQKPHLKQYHR